MENSDMIDSTDMETDTGDDSLDDLNGNSIGSIQSLQSERNRYNHAVKLRISSSRKREATRSFTEDPKRKDQLHKTFSTHLDRNCNMNYNVAVDKLNGNQHFPMFCDVSIDSSASNEVSVKNVNPHIGSGDCGSNSSSQEGSNSSSISDLSVQSSGNSVNLQDDLDCLHLNDEASLYLSNVRKLPLVPSLFHRVPPTIYFSSDDEKVHPLPTAVAKLLKWKLSTITPLCIRQVVERAGFKLVKGETNDWMGTWGKHMKSAAFKGVTEFQKVNHFPGSFHLGRKDKMWLIYHHMLGMHGSEEFDFFPETFVLPQDIRLLRVVWEKEGPQKRWIIKPPASARGTGIKVINRWSQIPKKRPIVVQRYLTDPYLINDTKFDLRLYVLVPSYEPLRIYIFNDGLVRFASERYSSSSFSLNDLYRHLTNYSINRKNSAYTNNDDENTCQGHKWSLKSLWGYLVEHNIDTNKIWEDILDLVIKTIICSESPMTRLIKNHTKNRYNCFELFGFDIMLDKDLKSWLLEVNISPSLHTSSPLDTKIKGQLSKDMFNIVGYQLPEKILKNVCPNDMLTTYGITLEEMQNMCMNKTMHQWYLSPEEKTKHHFFTNKNEVETLDKDILEQLTPDDVRHLVESEDELSRCGSFMRIFPDNTTSKYLRYFEHPRYYNLLFDAWEQKYCHNRSEGISLLQNLCQKNVHLISIFRDSP